MKHFLAIAITLLLSFSPLLKAQEIQNDYLSNYIFSYITMEEGLPNNFIDDMYKDHQGFLWIITYGGGLSRYDGYDFLYYNVNSYRGSLKSNFVKKVCEDNFHRLWIASEGGIDVLNLNTMEIMTPSILDPRFNVLLNRPSSMVLKDSKGSIWITTEKSFEKIDFDNKGAIKKVHQLKYAQPTTNEPDAFCEIDGQMWVGYNNAIYKISTDKNGNLILHPASSSLVFQNGTYISCMIEKENEIWIGTDHGLIRYNKLNESVKGYTHNELNPHSISQNFISDLQIAPDHQLIIATLKGINIYDPTLDCFVKITQDDKKNIQTLNCNFINCILCDGQTIWIGSEAGGLNKMTKRLLLIDNYIHNSENTGSISKNPVNSVYEDNKGNLWVGCVEGGLNYKQAQSRRFIHYTTANGLSHNSVSALVATTGNHLWVGTWGGGINILDKTSNHVINNLSSNSTGYNIDFIGMLEYDTLNNGMWIGSNRGIFFYDLTTNKLTNPLPSSIINNIQGCLGCIIDKKNNLWIGTTIGVVIIDLKSFHKNHTQFSCRVFRANPQNRASAFLNKTTSFLQASDGTMWIGSNGYGLIKIIQSKPHKIFFKPITTNEGLANNNVMQILEDKYHHLWIATCNGLSCFTPQTGHFVNYTKADGLCCNQFYWNGCFKSPNSGHLYFGNINGLIEINAELSKQNITAGKVVLTMLNVGNKSILPHDDHYLNSDISEATVINLHESDKSFSIEFSALNYDMPSSLIYQYRLLGFDDKWITVSSNRRFASYTNLPPGDYIFQVRCTSGSQNFSNNATEIKIHISPFFYKTWWFILLLTCFAIGIVYRSYRWRILSLKRQRMILQKKVEERTSELEKQKKLLEGQTKELSIQNNILSQQNEKITKQKTQLIEMAKKVQELTIDKLAFFTNITHEFRTPITLIIGPIERALKLSKNPLVIEQLNFVNRNSRHLLSLINQLMDFRKVESGNLTISRQPGNIEVFVDDLLIPFKAFANEKEIQFRPIYHFEDPNMMIDKEAMTKIITNLLSNAMKFTSNGGKVTLYLASLKNKQHKKMNLYICISDTGIGLVKGEMEKIFNRFYQSKGHEEYPVYGQSGTGIGLYLCKRLVNLMNGVITAHNNHRKGAAFRILIPLTKFENQEIKHTVEQTIDALNEIPNISTDERLTILVVEDNKDMRDYIQSILSDTYSIVKATNGNEALKILKNNPIDFIISDLMMPEMDGIELSRKVKDDFTISHIPFLMLTAKTAREAKLESLRNGVDDYILKPFDEEILKARITNLLENRKRYQQRFKMSMEIDSLHINEDSNDKKFIDKAIQLIKSNYKNSYYEVSDFVESMGVSKSLLNKKMQNLTGQSAGQFIRNYRLNLARELILKNRITKNMNISEIAYEVGFNDPKYFTRCFTKHFNTTPSSMFEGDSIKYNDITP